VVTRHQPGLGCTQRKVDRNSRLDGFFFTNVFPHQNHGDGIYVLVRITNRAPRLCTLFREGHSDDHSRLTRYRRCSSVRCFDQRWCPLPANAFAWPLPELPGPAVQDVWIPSNARATSAIDTPAAAAIPASLNSFVTCYL